MQITHHFGYDSHFIINLGESYMVKDYTFPLADFNTFFQNNDINVLADLFLNLKMDFNNRMYEYDRISEIFGKNWSNNETLKNNVQQFNEVMIAITEIYARLMRELPERQAETMAAFTNIITIANIVNYRNIQFDGTTIDIKPFLEQFSPNKKIQDAIFIEAVMQQRDAYEHDSNTDYTNDIFERIFVKMAADAGVSEKKLNEAYEEHNIIKNGSQQDLINYLIKNI